MKHIITMSYGISSWATGKLVAQRYGTDDIVLLFTDTKWEDEDTYKWGRAASANIGKAPTEISEGRTPWELFDDSGFIGRNGADLCSHSLKREMLKKWLAESCDPADTTVYFGIHWSEKDRFHRIDRKTGTELGIRPRMREVGRQAPLCEPPLIGYQELHDWAAREGLWQQKLYALGFSHANCGGRCVKQGIDGWIKLLMVMPERFKEVEDNENRLREKLGKDVAMLRDRKNGRSFPLPLTQLRQRVEGRQSCEGIESSIAGSCNCFGNGEEVPEVEVA